MKNKSKEPKMTDLRRRAKDAKKMVSPRSALLVYQREFVNDKSRFKIIASSRQIGKSMMTAYEAVEDCVVHPNSSWICVSAGQRQAYEWLTKAKRWVRTFQLWGASTFQRGVGDVVKSNVGEIEFANGSKIVALPPNPDTIRGYSGNLVLDEFALVDDDEEVWEAILPTISSEIQGHKFRVVIASTVNGTNNKFWDILSKPQGQVWSQYKIDVYKAVELGCNLDIEELKKGIGDEEMWAQEYLCEPVAQSSTAFPAGLIDSVTDNKKSLGASMWLADSDLAEAGARYVMGVDVARSKDYSVFWVCRVDPRGRLITREVRSFQGQKLSTQEEWIARYLRFPSVERCVIDETGMGAGVVDRLSDAFGERVVGFTFTRESKTALFTAMRSAFEDKRIVIPRDRAVFEDILAMQRFYSKDGNIKYSAPRRKGSHSDRATACALCIHAFSMKSGVSHSGAWCPSMGSSPVVTGETIMGYDVVAPSWSPAGLFDSLR
ncbi:MAG: terminase family protein [Bacteroidales bacterium]|nr:terminase family protein [Bacteroidales bacterium]